MNLGFKINFKAAAAGFLSGAANGFFGSGGGLIAVPMLESDGTEAKRAHATSVAVMLPLSIVSALIYQKSGAVDLSEAARYIPGGLLGAGLGTLIMKKISPAVLRKLFAAVMIYFGIRMLVRG